MDLHAKQLELKTLVSVLNRAFPECSFVGFRTHDDVLSAWGSDGFKNVRVERVEATDMFVADVRYVSQFDGSCMAEACRANPDAATAAKLARGLAHARRTGQNTRGFGVDG